MTRLGLFQDVRDLMDRALQTGGGTLTFPSNSDAHYWRHRAYRFRKLYAAKLGPAEASPYDRLIIHRIPKGGLEVRLSLRDSQVVFTPAGVEADDLLQVAQDFSGKLDLL